MREIQSQEKLQKYLISASQYTKKEDFYNGNHTPFVAVTIPEDINIKIGDKERKLKNGDKFILYANDKLCFSQPDNIDSYKKHITVKKANEEMYKEELYLVPEQKRDAIERLLANIEDSIRQCEMYIGEMRDAQSLSDETKFNKAKKGLQKELVYLKGLEVKTREDKAQGLYGKVVSIKAMNEIQRVEDILNQTHFQDKDKVEKLNKTLKEKKNNYYIIHLNDMLAMKENLSKQEQIDTMSALGSVSLSPNYKQVTTNAYRQAYDKVERDGAMTDVKDGNYENDKRDDTVANATKPYKSQLDLINEAIEEDDREDPYEERKLYGV